MLNRKEILAKSGGKCWYCGELLPARGWHIDHVVPILRSPTGARQAQNNTIENAVPACAPCNLFKNVLSLEDFRQEIAEQVRRARKSSVNFRTAERFGQLVVTGKPVIFWFETQRDGD